MKNVKEFFAWIAGAPELWEQFLLVMQEISPSDTEIMYEKLAAFATQLGFEEAAAEMKLFYEQEVASTETFTQGVQGVISGY